MPIFEYRCLKCHQEFEKLLTSKSTPVDCPGCSSQKVEKKFSSFGMKTSSRFVSSATGGGCATCNTRNCSSCR